MSGAWNPQFLEGGGKIPTVTQMECCILLGANGRRSGSAKLVTPSPPKLMPTREMPTFHARSAAILTN